MKSATQTLRTADQPVDLYRAFRRLSHQERRRVALRILRNQKVLADLYDHFLIQEALREGGRRTPWPAYLARKRPAVR